MHALSACVHDKPIATSCNQMVRFLDLLLPLSRCQQPVAEAEHQELPASLALH